VTGAYSLSVLSGLIRTVAVRAVVVTVATLMVAGCAGGANVQAALRKRPAQHSAYADIPAMLDLQAQALVAGDETGWLAPVDPTAFAVVQRYRDLYRAMHAVGVATLTPIINKANVTDIKPGTRLTVVVGYTFCIQVPNCPTSKLDNGTTETMITRLTFIDQGDRPIITGFELTPIPTNGLGRAPWIDDPALEFLTGTRVTVIASADLKRRMPVTLAAADAAATVADRYAQWVWPSRYIVYLANPHEWQTWIAAFPGVDGVVAYAAAPSPSSEVVVVNVALQDTNAEPLEGVLQHEFGHVVTLLGLQRNRVTASQTFLEGIAEYIAQDGRPLSSYLPLTLTRQYIHSGRWDGDIDSIDKVFRSDSPRDVEAAYGMGMLTVRCIADKFGQPKMLDFLAKLFRTPVQPPETAAPAVLGQPWTAVKTTCASYLRQI
jgi:hypothetical protein